MGVGTGFESDLLLKEQATISDLGTGQRSVRFRRHEHSFNKKPNLVTSDYAASSEIGIMKEVSHFISGRIRAELDMTTIVDILKWHLGSLSTVSVGGSAYCHTLKFGTAFKYFKAFLNEGGLGTPLYRNYIGNAVNSFTLFVPRMDTVYWDARLVGQTNEGGSDQGAATFTADEQTVVWSGFKTYVGVAGATEILEMTSRWYDPFTMKLDISRDINADNYQSDQLGYTDDITDGKVRAAVNFVTKLRTTHRIADFEAGTEIAMAITLDTGVPIPSGNGNNYWMVIIFPRGRFASYDREVPGEGTIEPVIDFFPMFDKTAGYSMRIDVYNNTASYPNATP